MESNGKRVTRDGEPIDYATGPVLWGEPGTNSQHSFLQELHQGTRLIPADFLLPAVSAYPSGPHHDLLIANCLAQTEALMKGRTEAEVRAELAAAGLRGPEVERLVPHKIQPGNQPTNMLLFRRLDPRTLGMLVALYEHKTSSGRDPAHQFVRSMGRRAGQAVGHDARRQLRTPESASATLQRRDCWRRSARRAHETAAGSATTTDQISFFPIWSAM
jgi:hypothetical protein